jgi:hypothetical protein
MCRHPLLRDAEILDGKRHAGKRRFRIDPLRPLPCLVVELLGNCVDGGVHPLRPRDRGIHDFRGAHCAFADAIGEPDSVFLPKQ